MSEVDYTILDRPYRLNVSDDDEKYVAAAVDLINHRADAIRAGDRSLTRERVAVMVALQVAYETLRGTLTQPPVDREALARVSHLITQCETALHQEN